MNTNNLKNLSLYGAREMDSREVINTRLLIEINTNVIPALELAIDGDDCVRINNIMKEYNNYLYKQTGIWYNNFNYYDEYRDNLNDYISLLINRINKIFG